MHSQRRNRAAVDTAGETDDNPFSSELRKHTVPDQSTDPFNLSTGVQPQTVGRKPVPFFTHSIPPQSLIRRTLRHVTPGQTDAIYVYPRPTFSQSAIRPLDPRSK